MSYYDLKEPKVDIPLDYEGGIKEIETYSLLEILQPRAEEIFSFLHEEIVQNRLNCFMPSGLVITGGGSPFWIAAAGTFLVSDASAHWCATLLFWSIGRWEPIPGARSVAITKICDRIWIACICLQTKANLTSQWRGHAVIGKSISSYENMDL